MSGLVTSYLCVQGWGEDSSGVSVGEILSADSGTTLVTNGEAAASTNLGDFTTLTGATGASTVSFNVDVSIQPNDASLDGKYALGLIGLRIKPSSRDVVLRATLQSGSEVYESAATIYGLDMERDLPVGNEGHFLFGSGVSNIVFHNLPADTFDSTLTVTLAVDSNIVDLGDRDVLLGAVCPFLEIPMSIERTSVAMGFAVMHDENTTRGGNDISSNGVLKRTLAVQAKEMPMSALTGISDGYYDGDFIGANMMRAAIANVGQPMLMSLFPYPVDSSWGDFSGLSPAQVEARNLSRRQNFYAIYGKLDRQIDVTIDESFEAGESTWRARLRFGERR
jgi:hypothetical protein